MSRIANVTVYERDGESFERLLKRFVKKCKKQEVLKDWYDHNDHFKSKSEKRREKRLRAKFLRRKEAKNP